MAIYNELDIFFFLICKTQELSDPEKRFIDPQIIYKCSLPYSNLEPQEPTTPITKVTWDQFRKPTPVKARIQGAIDFLKSEGIKGKNEAVFRANSVSHATGYRIIRSSNPRTLKNDPTREETRRGHSKITLEQFRKMEKIPENEGLEGRSLTWMPLGFEAQVEASEATIQRAIGTLQYYKCLACQRSWQSPSNKKNRVQFAESMLARYTNPEDWDCVRFSNEVHFGWGPQHHLRIIRKPGQHYYVDCIQYSDTFKLKDKKRFHFWAAVGYDFKSDLTFYEVPGNPNGKISLQVYINQILEPMVKPWLLEKQDFVLEEDGDSRHSKAKNRNIVTQWKKENNLEYFFNCASSPNLSPIENCWQPSKQHLKKFSHWDDCTTKELIVEGWDLVSHHFINEKCQSMPQRLRDVILSEGNMVGYYL